MNFFHWSVFMHGMWQGETDKAYVFKCFIFPLLLPSDAKKVTERIG